MAVSVHKLVQRGRADDAVRDRIALEDALSTALPDDGRLVLVRRMQVYGQVADPAARQAAVRRGWVEAVSGAIHATHAGASNANCVWFASRQEAEALLLRKLLAGEQIDGWFWKLAVPGWSDLPVADWLPLALAECLTRNESDRLARLAETCVRAGFAQQLVDAIERACGRPGSNSREAWRVSVNAFSAETVRIAVTADEMGESARRIAASLAPLVLPPHWTEVLDRLERSAVSPANKLRIVDGLLQERTRRASPALSLRPQLLRLVAKSIAEMRDRRRLDRPARAKPSPAPDSEVPVPERAGGAKLDRAPRDHPTVTQDWVRGDRPTSPADRTADVSYPGEAGRLEAAGPALLRTSRHAGLWLVVPPLIHLGFREWLAARIELLGQHPGRSLILAIARHHRVAVDDPAVAMLTPIGGDCPLPEWTEAWRIGIDRWLRRTVRRRTHDLIRRPGSIRVDEERVDIHFPLDAADLRLRRSALDSDPGWTDWLGLSLHYYFGAGDAP